MFCVTRVTKAHFIVLFSSIAERNTFLPHIVIQCLFWMMNLIIGRYFKSLFVSQKHVYIFLELYMWQSPAWIYDLYKKQPHHLFSLILTIRSGSKGSILESRWRHFLQLRALMSEVRSWSEPAGCSCSPDRDRRSNSKPLQKSNPPIKVILPANWRN